MITNRCNGGVDQQLSYSLVGTRIEDSALCEPDYGTVSSNVLYRYISFRPREVVTINKDAGDEFWAVRIESTDGELMDEFLARSLGARFYCDIADI